MKKYRLILLTLFTFGCASVGPVTNVSDPEFIALFEKERTSEKDELKSIVTVEKYIHSCCAEKDKLISLLDRNGFDVNIIERTEQPEFFDKYAFGLHLSESDDTYVSGFRKLNSVGLIPPPTYEVHVNYSDEKITNIAAYVRRPAPF